MTLNALRTSAIAVGAAALLLSAPLAPADAACSFIIPRTLFIPRTPFTGLSRTAMCIILCITTLTGTGVAMRTATILGGCRFRSARQHPRIGRRGRLSLRLRPLFLRAVRFLPDL